MKDLKLPSVFDRKLNLIQYITKSSCFYLLDILNDGPIDGDTYISFK